MLRCVFSVRKFARFGCFTSFHWTLSWSDKNQKLKSSIRFKERLIYILDIQCNKRQSEIIGWLINSLINREPIHFLVSLSLSCWASTGPSTEIWHFVASGVSGHEAIRDISCYWSTLWNIYSVSYRASCCSVKIQWLTHASQAAIELFLQVCIRLSQY